MFSVVKFLTENSVEIAPSSWIKDGLCAWPTGPGVNSLIKKCCQPSPSWPNFEIKVLGCYEKYDIAVSKRRIAEYSSDLEENSEPQRKKTGRLSRKDSEHYVISNLPPVPSFQLAPGSGTHLNEVLNISEDLSTNSNRTVSLTTDRLENNIHSSVFITELNESQPKSYISPQVAECSATYKDNTLEKDRCFLREIVGLKTNVRHLISYMEGIEAKQDIIISLLNNPSPLSSKTKSTFIQSQCKTVSELEELDASLKDDEKFQLAKHQLSMIGGGNTKEFVRRILTKIFADNLAALFSFKGRKGNLNFSTYNIYSLLLEIVQEKLNASEKDVENAVMEWFRHVTQRYKSTVVG